MQQQWGIQVLGSERLQSKCKSSAPIVLMQKFVQGKAATFLCRLYIYCPLTNERQAQTQNTRAYYLHNQSIACYTNMCRTPFCKIS